jgi:Predicted membrane protein (DUF2142)
MAEPESHSPPAFSESKERNLVFLLCGLAAVHVCVFSAAFPFFNAVDEWDHFDLMVKYSQGHLPHPRERVSAESAPYLVIYNTPEYLWPSNNFPIAQFPPLWTQPPEKAAPVISRREAAWRLETNFEMSQPPLYYLLAGLWWRLAKVCGLQGGSLLYSVRFLNGIIVAALVWLAFVTARLVFPGQRFLRLGVPALVAFMPQTAFYSIQNDLLASFCFSAAFICLIHLSRAEVPGRRLGVATGLALAATFLANLSNLPLLAVSGMVVLFQVRRWIKAGKWQAALPAIKVLVWCAGLPMIAWAAWCEHAFGSFTGTTDKIQFLGWTYRPFSQWWHHPIFTPHGLWTFVSGLMATFWQGEFLWHRVPLAWPVVSTAYAGLSVGFIGAALVVLLPRFTMATQSQRQVLWLGFWCLVATVAFLGFLSVIFDFGGCFYPSQAHPYFTSGRLMLGALIPFLLLYVYGLDRVLNRVRRYWLKPLVLTGLILFMLISEIAIDWQIFQNPYNWYHM